MRPLAAAALALVVSLVAASPAAAQERYPWNDRAASAASFAKKRSGSVSWAVVSPDGRVRGHRIHARYPSASVVKAMLLVAYLNRADVARRRLRPADMALLRPMILRSGNKEATRVRNLVGNGALERLARRARMKDFATSTRSWGLTQISAYDQARFFWRIDRFVPARHRAYARSLLAGIVTRHRWGIPPAVPDGWKVLLKGGWSQPRRAHQVARLERGRERISIAVLTDGARSFDYGQATIEGVARRLLLGLNDFACQGRLGRSPASARLVAKRPRDQRSPSICRRTLVEQHSGSPLRPEREVRRARLGHARPRRGGRASALPRSPRAVRRH